MATSDLPCPRCGADVGLNVSGDVVCPHDLCKAFWPSKKAYDHECVARGLTSMKSKSYGKEYLAGSGEGTVRDELAELVALTTFVTLQNVYDAVDTSIKGREHMIDSGNSYSDKAKGLSYEIAALENMREWLRSEMDQYGEPK